MIFFNFIKENWHFLVCLFELLIIEWFGVKYIFAVGLERVFFVFIVECLFAVVFVEVAEAGDGEYAQTDESALSVLHN